MVVRAKVDFIAPGGPVSRRMYGAAGSLPNNRSIPGMLARIIGTGSRSFRLTLSKSALLYPSMIGRGVVIIYRDSRLRTSGGGGMAALYEALESQKATVDRKATGHREARDRFNVDVRTHLNRRNELNDQVSSLIDEAKRQRAVRDEQNQNVRDAKEVREERTQAVRDLKKQIQDLRSERGGDFGAAGQSPHQLRREFQRLESEYEHGRHQGKHEKKVLKRLQDLSRMLKQITEDEEGDEQAKEIRECLNAALEHQEEAHELVTEAAEQAQGAHDLMIRIHKEVDRLREEADESQRSLLESKRQADKNHRGFVMSIRSLHSIQDMLKVLDNRSEYEEKEGERAKEREEVDDIMLRLMKGETVDTDELLALQRHGG